MESLLNQFGGSAVWPILIAALPLGVIGLVLRRAARHRLGDAVRARRAERPLAQVRPGMVTVRGRWRTLPDGKTLVEDESALVLVERASGAAPIADGTPVVVVGCATERQAGPGGYRDGGAVWLIDTRLDGGLVSPRADALDRRVRAARLRSALGAALFATGLAVAAATAVISFRATHASYDIAD
jgi:hypothetical protein